MLNRITRATALLLALLLLMAAIPPIPARAQSRIIRVGWFESPFNATDALGRRSGYAYDYQQKIAAYTGWTYEYVEGSWSDLLQMLSEGRIDLLSDVSYTPERAERMLYSALPMGAEEYYLYISPRNTEIQPQEYATFNGKRVGANKGSVQIDLLREWS
ncbi:MAG: substrate-binding periplasmic protein, partial [bacterium]